MLFWPTIEPVNNKVSLCRYSHTQNNNQPNVEPLNPKLDAVIDEKKRRKKEIQYGVPVIVVTRKETNLTSRKTVCMYDWVVLCCCLSAREAKIYRDSKVRSALEKMGNVESRAEQGKNVLPFRCFCNISEIVFDIVGFVSDEILPMEAR